MNIGTEPCAPDIHASFTGIPPSRPWLRSIVVGKEQGEKMVFSNVIVPLDGSRDAASAIPVARSLATLGGGRISLVRVVHRPAGLFASHVNQVHNASAYLDEVVRDELARVEQPVSTSVRSGDVVEAILSEVDDTGSSVIVMATRGHSGVVRAMLGSVASELLSKSPVPVVVVRAGAQPMEHVRQILVPVDGSAESERAMSAAADLAAVAGANMTLLQVVPPGPIPTWASETAVAVELGQYADPGQVDRAALADARQYVNTLAGRLETKRVSVEALAMLGDVPKTITETAEGIRADLIVMRTRGHTGATRAVLGSVADEVVRSAGVPVMLLRGDRVSAEVAKARQDRSLVGEPVW
jgi:nucleotide-binding universal stress UspA family protein